MNNVTLIAGHVLLPHQADWSTLPSMQRTWSTDAPATLGGRDSRTAQRPVQPWVTLNYEVLPHGQVERARFERRWTAGLASGRMAVPWWGKGGQLFEEATEGHEQLSLDRDYHGLAAGGFAFLQPHEPSAHDTWDAVLVASVAGRIVGLGSAIENYYAAGTRVWPILFGKPIPDDFQPINSTRSRFRVRIMCDARQVNAFAHDGFGDYAPGPVAAPLDGGTGWNGPWVLGEAA